MKMRATIILALLAVLLASCSQAGDLREERDSALSKQKGDIQVGVAWPFATQDDGFKEGLELALDEINQSGGVLGSPIKLIEQDDQSSVTDGLTIAENFANNPALTAVIGHRSSAVAVPASKVYDNAGLVMLAPSSTSPGLTSAGLDRVFRLIPDDNQIGSTMAHYAQTSGYRNVAIFYTNDEYGRGLAHAFEDEAASAGIQIIDRVSDYKNLNDLRRLADKWRLLGGDAIFVAEAMPDAATFIADLRQAGWNVPIIGGDGLDSEDLAKEAGAAAEGTVVASIFNPLSGDEQVRHFVEAYESKYKAEPLKWAAQGYDSLQLLAYAIGQAGSREPAKVAEALRQTQSWTGVSGTRSFDTDGNIHDMPIVLKQLKDGAFEYLNGGGAAQ